MIREVFAKHSGKTPPAPPADVPSKAYGAVTFAETALLIDNLDVLAKPEASELPDVMENYAQGYVSSSVALTAAAAAAFKT